MSWSSADISHLKINDIIYSHIHKQKKVLNFYDNYNLDKGYSIKELYDQVQMQKSIFLKYLTKGEVIFISWPLSFEFIVYFLALLEIEVIPAPILAKENFSNLSEYMAYLIELKKNSGVMKVLAPLELRDELVSQGFEVVQYEEHKNMSQSKNNPQKPYIFNSSEYPRTAYLQFPLHSRGVNAKAVIYSHQKLIKNIVQIKESLLIDENLKSLSQTNLCDDLGLLAGIILPLCVGYEQHFIEKTSFYKAPKDFLKLTEKLKINLWFASAEMYEALSRIEFTEKDKIDLSNLEICLCGVEPVAIHIYENFKAVFSKYRWKEKTFIPFYSPKANNILAGALNNHKDLNYIVRDGKKIASLGQPFPGVHYRIVDENNYPLGEEQEGLICIKSNMFASGVLNSNISSEAKLSELSWFNTKDVGFISNGELYLTGRCSDKLFTEGKWYSVADLEARMAQFLKNEKWISGVHILGIDNKKNQDDIYVVLESTFSFRWFFSLQSKKIKNRISEKFSVSPQNIIFSSKKKLPYSAQGVLKKFVLRRELKSTYTK
jgi:fatty-acyl-CoA synthase